MYLPGARDIKVCGQVAKLLLFVFLVSWWWYPLLLIWWVSVLTLRGVVWIAEEVNYLGYLNDRSR
jgi:hypothetical protein